MERSPTSRPVRRVAAYLLPGLVLVLVALNQVRLAHVADLTPWKGGGFGMFASTDRINTRLIRVWFVRPDGEERPVQPGPAVRKPMRDARAFPSEENLRAIARPMAERARSLGREPEAIRVEFFKQLFDHETAELRPVKTREIVYRPGDEEPADGD